MFLRNVGITCLIDALPIPNNRLCVEAEALWSLYFSSCSCLVHTRQTSAIRRKYEVPWCWRKERRNLKKRRHFLCTDINKALIFCPVISRTDSGNLEGGEGMSKEAGKSLTELLGTSCSLWLFFYLCVRNVLECYCWLNENSFVSVTFQWNTPGNILKQHKRDNVRIT